MKLNQKIFLLSFFLIIITEFTIGFIIISSSHNNNLNLYIENSKKEHNNIRNLIFTEISELQNSRNSSIDYKHEYINDNKIMPQSIVKTCYNISNNYKNSQMPTNIYLYINDNLIYRNDFVISDEILKELHTKDDMLISYVANVENKKKLFTSSNFIIEDTTYTFITKNDINEIYILKDNIIDTFLIISLFFPFIISFAIISIIHIITKKIEQLDFFTQNISYRNDYYEIPVFSGTDEISKLSYTLRDTFGSIQENIKNIEKISDNRKMFINELMHEINTPISSMLLFSSIINDKSKNLSDKKREEYLAIINNRASYISGIKDTLINILLNNKDEKSFDYCNVSEVIKKTCKELNYYFTHQNITIETNIQKNVIFKTDPFLIQCLLENLVKNSSNSYKDGGKIYVSLTKKFLKVVDFGCGIPECELHNITKPFFSISNTFDKDSNHMGIGLTLCQEIARLHHGKLEIKNNKTKSGVSSTFYFNCKEENYFD